MLFLSLKKLLNVVAKERAREERAREIDSGAVSGFLSSLNGLWFCGGVGLEYISRVVWWWDELKKDEEERKVDLKSEWKVEEKN